MGRKVLNLDGKTFGRLTATNKIKRFGNVLKRFVHCECGKNKWIATGDLTRGHDKSCGCLAVASRKLKPGMSARNSILDGYKRGATDRGLSWSISDDEFDILTQKACFYCGRKPYRSKKTRGNNGNFIYNGIDRLDNSNGYVLSNIVPCCTICNRAKNNMRLDEFLLWIKDLCDFNAKIL